MDNCIYVTKFLLTKLKVRYTKQFLEDSILSHPDHPSLLCVSDTLEKYRIETLAVKVGIEKLRELPFPCIVQLSNQGGMFRVLESFSNGKANYFDDKGKHIRESTEVFLKKWTGICLLAEPSMMSKEPGIEKTFATKRAMSILKWTTVILLGSWSIANITNRLLDSQDSYLIGGYIILKLIGLTAGVMLLWYEVDKYNPTLQSFCSGGKKINCDSVLSSKYSKVFNGQLTLSLIGFAYFFGTLAFLIFNDLSNTSMALLTYLSHAALPVVIISAYYQSIVIKQWCKFCIIVQTVLLCEAVTVFVGDFYSGVLGLDTIPLLFALLLLPIPVWKWLKPLLEGQKEVNLFKRGLKKIKNNPDVLHGLLIKSRKIKSKTDGLGISFTNEKAKYSLVKVCNPYCGPCAKAHPVLEELVKKGKINLQIIFTSSLNTEDTKTKPVEHFMAINSEGNKKKMQAVLDDWYLSEKKDYETFARRYPINGQLEIQDEEIAAMSKWCEVEKITHTPTIFINGHELPREYSVTDLNEVLN